MATATITKPEGATQIMFKHEGHENGSIVGPACWVGNGNIIANLIDSEFEDTIPTMDITTREIVPMPKFEPEWMLLREVNKVAKHFGVEVYEA